MRVLQVLSATLALAGAALAQEAKTVTLSTAAMRLPFVLEEVAKQTGKRLVCDPAMANEPLVVHVEGVDADVLLQRIALATRGAWQEREPGVFRIVPNEKARRQLKDAEIAERLASFKTAYQKIRDLIVKPPKPPKPDAANDEDNYEPTFGNRDKCLAAILLSVSPEAIARLDRYDRLVFSTNPNASQRPLRLPSGAIEQLVAAVNADYEATNEDDADGMDVRPLEVAESKDPFSEFEMMTEPSWQGKPIKSPVAKVLVYFKGDHDSDRPAGGVRLYDAKGAVVYGAGFESLMWMVDEEMWNGPAKPDAKPAPDPILDRAFKPSALATAYSAFGRYSSQSSSKNPPQDLLEFLRHCDVNEPAKAGMGEVVLELAKARAKPFVACLQEDAASPYSLRSMRTLRDADKYLNSYTRMATDDDWLVYAVPDSDDLQRVDRVLLAGLIASSEAKGAVTLDEVASFAANMPDRDLIPSWPNFQLIEGFPGEGFGMGDDAWLGYALYGMLQPGERRLLAQGGRLVISSLTPTVRELIRQSTFGMRASLRVDRPRSVPKPISPLASMFAQYIPEPEEDYQNEPTEIMPNGIPANAYLSMTSDREPVAFTSSWLGRSMGGMNVDMMAFVRFMIGALPEGISEAEKQDLTTIRLGIRTQYTMRLDVAPRVYQRFLVFDDKVDPKAPSVSLFKLPTDLEAQIAKRLEALSKLQDSMKESMGDGQEPDAP